MPRYRWNGGAGGPTARRRKRPYERSLNGRATILLAKDCSHLSSKPIKALAAIFLDFICGGAQFRLAFIRRAPPGCENAPNLDPRPVERSTAGTCKRRFIRHDAAGE